jgi:hypothetical protein
LYHKFAELKTFFRTRCQKRLLGLVVAGIFIKSKKAISFRNEPNHLPQTAPARFTQKKSSPPGKSKLTAPGCRLRNVFWQRHLK